MSLIAHLTLVFLCLGTTHVLWWRIHPPRHPRRALLQLFIAGGMVAIPAAEWVATRLGFEPLSWMGRANALLAVVAFASAYVVTYSVVEADSPTLSLVRHIAGGHTQGLDLEDLKRFLGHHPFVETRIKAMLDEGMAEQRDGRVFVGPKRPWLLVLVSLYRRKILGIGEVGG